ncbi:hypothetical protein NliqN6_0332 [Naganishia liquefaciens]|uniref:Vacuolar protein-sorting-associated protein 36 n=1 Tax=Naganishia liquefaciens TaxID=104408 RepID=A0A8H3TMQ5_9TREE|nr:hypothetical protein NliqN6_0332 [Naganishia liquefaciens]
MDIRSSFLLALPVSVPTRNPTPTALAHAALQDGEEWIYAQDGVGLYQGNTKIPTHQILSVQLTTHRLLFICSSTDAAPNLQVRLADIRQIEHYTGFLRSSPKVTLQLGVPQTTTLATDGRRNGSWTCTVCGCVNDDQTGTMATGTSKCRLCGIARAETDVAPPALAAPSACPRCTFLNSPTRAVCEICNARLPTTAQKAPPPNEVIRISFRKGGDREVYRRLKVVLESRTWEGRSAGTGGEARAGTPSRGIGIDGILAGISLENKAKTDEVKDAFEDLEALMVRAGEMVKLVQSLNAKLSTTAPQTTNSGKPDPEAETRTFLRSSLVQLGLPVPAITQDPSAMQSEREYLDALSGELGGLLTGGREGEGLMTGREGKGLVGMDEAWVVWNRARGVSLISPSVMQKVVPLLPGHTNPPVSMLRFLSGLEVLHTPVYSPSNFARRIRRRLEQSIVRASSPSDRGDALTPAEPNTTTLEIALVEALSVSMAREMMAFIEMLPEAGLVRDDQGGSMQHGAGVGGGPVEERWYRDLITGFVWVDVNTG